MINGTKDVLFKIEGEKLKQALREAIINTRNILFNEYSGGVEIADENITSSSRGRQGKPKTIELAFCKYFKPESVSNIGQPIEDYISTTYKIYSTKTRNLNNQEASLIVPNYNNIDSGIPAILLTHVARGIGIMLFSLWSQGAILMTPFYSAVRNKKNGSHDALSLITSPLNTEVMRYFQGYRSTIDKKNGGLKPVKGLSKSMQSNLQACGLRFLVSTDWHCIEDVNIKDAVAFMKLMRSHAKGDVDFISMPLPMKEMLKMLSVEFPDRVQYSFDDYIRAQENVDVKVRSTESYAPEAIQERLIINEVQDYDIEEASKNWIDSQLSYIDKRRKRGIKNVDTISKHLSIFNRYLFDVIPSFRHENLIAQKPYVEPRDFSRVYLDGDENTPSFIEYVCDSRTPTTAYGILSTTDTYFSYLERISHSYEAFKGFKNPIVRSIDFPLLKRSYGTTKNIVREKHFPSMISYFYALDSFINYVIEKVVINRKDASETDNIVEQIENISRRSGGDWVETENYGYIPYIRHNEKAVPLKRIHKSGLSIVTRRFKNHGSVSIPNPLHLTQFLVALETGIRNKHIQWLDCDKYDCHIDREKDLPAICKLEVSTDKIKQRSWTPYVSRRVIRLLDGLKRIRDLYDESWTSEKYYYDEHEHTHYEKIRPLFSRGGTSSKPGLPCHYTTYSGQYRKLLLSYQEFCNENRLFEEAVSMVEVYGYENYLQEKTKKLRSEITPHSARATVVSNHIKILPPSVIGKYITGHESDHMIAYYTVLDPDYITRAETEQSLSLAVNRALNIAPDNALKADTLDAGLRGAINKDLSAALSDFGGTSFERENSSGEIESGLSITQNLGINNLAFNSTHICPYNNSCPEDVKKEVGKMNCGQCWASIKTVDHLPRIMAHIRHLHSLHEDIANSIKSMISAGVSEDLVASHESQRHIIASEEAAWIASAEILENFRQSVERRQDFLVKRPEIIEKHLQRITTEDSPLVNILTRVNDAKSYPEYFTPQLKASITKLRNKILARTGEVDRILNQPEDFSMLDEFRGIIRGVCEASGASLEDISNMMKADIKPLQNTPKLLEVS